MLLTDTGKELDDYESDDEVLRSYPEYEDHHYGYKPKKKKVYVPVFVPDKEKKKSKLDVCFVFLCFPLNTRSKEGD